MPLLTVNNLKVERGGISVLEIPLFSLNEGETLAILGPNGAGKTTFLLTLARLLGYIQGKLLFKGEDISLPERTVPYRRRLAMVFQEPLLWLVQACSLNHLLMFWFNLQD
ncbi:MAG: hypothetical protein CO171_09075 [Syntrophobacterales bacterium CG_4_9_14_3_um_filter_49_8]|nr:MAG: hypothetical protein CO171_09075 [Syntrophobacterales bacterium CG_4_9_14_3_um_filter_49_8]